MHSSLRGESASSEFTAKSWGTASRPPRSASTRPRGLILSGGPASVYAERAPRCDPQLFHMGIPVLGICYGMQLACDTLGGAVTRVPAHEYGRTRCRVLSHEDLFAGIPAEIDVWMSHGDQVSHVSDDFAPLAETPTCSIAAVKHRGLPVYGLQFHPEVTHTAVGASILRQLCRGHLWVSGNLEAGRFRR